MAMAPLICDGGRPVKANLPLDSGVARSALVEMLAKRDLPELA